MNNPTALFHGWLAHDDDNVVSVWYSPRFDTPKQERRELTKLIRRGLTVREVRDIETLRQSRCLGEKVSEADLKRIAKPVAYDPDEMTATEIADKLATDRPANLVPVG